MSATNTENVAANPHPWLQPVRYDHDEYRLFVEALDGDLAELVSRHSTRPLVDPRDWSTSFEFDGVGDPPPQTPPEQKSC